MNVKAFSGGPLGVNTYVLYNENNAAIVIDPSDYQSIISVLVKNSFTLNAVLLTHGHFDHIWALSELENEYHNSLPVYIHKNDARMLNDIEHNLYKPFTGKSFSNRFCFDKPVVFDEDCVININGMVINVITTPGHSLGSVCYLIDNFLFTGDTLFRLSAGRTDFPDSDSALLKKSLKKIYELDKDYTVFPGHGDASSLFFEKRYNPYINEYNKN